uniref:Uncharacterized protein n=1 Tax=Chrysotila carterae TaxID=13221 RepID=A0A7S4BHI6_CHRCT
MLSLARRAQLHAVATSINVTGGTITIIITAIASIVVSFPAENWREVVLEVVAAGANGGHQLASRRCRSAIPAAKAGISIISIAIEGVLLLRLQCLHLRFVLQAREKRRVLVLKCTCDSKAQENSTTLSKPTHEFRER